jgi:hypothetical protein
MTYHGKFGEPPQQPRRKSWLARHKVLTGFLASGTILIIGGIASAADSPHSSTSTLTVQTTPPASPGSLGTAPPTHPATEQASRPAMTPHAVATFTGSGTENTPKFTVTSTWELDYSFSCRNFGSSGNFMVFEDGGNDFNGVDVNDLAVSKTGSTWAYDDSGTHYLEIDSECNWTVKAIDQG